MVEHPSFELPARLVADGFDRVNENVHAVLGGVDDSLLTWRPGPDANPVGWLVWHLSRIEDAQLAGLVEVLGLEGAGQVWVSGGWYGRFGLPYAQEATGYGQSSADVAAFHATGADLLGYQDAVHTQVLAVLAGLRTEHYDRIVDTRWTPNVTAAVRLVSMLDDCAQHAGQAAYVKGLAASR